MTKIQEERYLNHIKKYNSFFTLTNKDKPHGNVNIGIMACYKKYHFFQSTISANGKYVTFFMFC